MNVCASASRSKCSRHVRAPTCARGLRARPVLVAVGGSPRRARRRFRAATHHPRPAVSITFRISPRSRPRPDAPRPGSQRPCSDRPSAGSAGPGEWPHTRPPSRSAPARRLRLRRNKDDVGLSRLSRRARSEARLLLAVAHQTHPEVGQIRQSVAPRRISVSRPFSIPSAPA